MDLDKIKWEKFLGVELTEKEIKAMIEDGYWHSWRRGVHNISTGNIKLCFSNYSGETIVEVYKRIKLGRIPKGVKIKNET